MDIKRFLPIKRLRRSSRLCVKDKIILDNAKMADAVSTGPLGYFDLLPIELRFRVFSFLSVEDLSLLTITSKAMRNMVEGYRVTRFSGPHCMSCKEISSHLSVEDQAVLLQKFQKFGLLMKRSTCLYATKDRLKIINGFLSKICCSTDACRDPSRCLGLLCFGKFLHTVIAGWDDSECQRAFDAICQHACLHKHTKIVVSSKPGTHSHLETSVRLFFRRIFLDNCSSIADTAFWISRILKPWPIVFQARLLLILYCGHFSSGKIQWHEMSENTPADIAHSKVLYNGMAAVLQILHQHSSEWSCDEVICILDEMTSTPDDWLVENVAGLLIACGESITAKMLASKAINGRYLELTSVLASFCVVCVKFNYGLKQVMTMLESVINVIENTRERVVLINKLIDTFKDLVLDTHEFTDSDDGNDNEFYHHLTAFTDFSKHLAHLAYKHVFSP